MVEKPMKDTKTGSNKRRFTLLPIPAMRAILDVFESGNIDLPWRKAYPVNSWRATKDIKESMLKYIDALMRHLFDLQAALQEGDDSYFTEDTGVYTAGAIGFGAIALTQFSIELKKRYPSRDGKDEIEHMAMGQSAYSKVELDKDFNKSVELGLKEIAEGDSSEFELEENAFEEHQKDVDTIPIDNMDEYVKRLSDAPIVKVEYKDEPKDVETKKEYVTANKDTIYSKDVFMEGKKYEVVSGKIGGSLFVVSEQGARLFLLTSDYESAND